MLFIFLLSLGSCLYTTSLSLYKTNMYQKTRKPQIIPTIPVTSQKTRKPHIISAIPENSQKSWKISKHTSIISEKPEETRKSAQIYQKPYRLPNSVSKPNQIGIHQNISSLLSSRAFESFILSELNLFLKISWALISSQTTSTSRQLSLNLFKELIINPDSKCQHSQAN